MVFLITNKTFNVTKQTVHIISYKIMLIFTPLQLL